MKALSMYSGGCDGLALAASWVGIETVAFCDADAKCREKLMLRHPGSPVFGLDTEVTADAIIHAGIDPGTIDILLASPPCQCASVAGKGLGAVDERNRWPEFLRIVGDIKPQWIMAENVPGLLTAKDAEGVKGGLFGSILAGLAAMGYRVGWGVYAASDIGAPHRRKRLAIVASRERSGGLADTDNGRWQPQEAVCTGGHTADNGGAAVADCDGQRQQQPRGDKRKGGGWTGDGGQGVADTTGGQQHRGMQARERRCGLADGSSAERHSAMVNTGGARCKERHVAAIAGGTGRAAGGLDPGGGARAAQPGMGVLPDGLLDRLVEQRWPHPRMMRGPSPQFGWEPPRVAQGVKGRTQDIKMLGNAVVPQWAAITLACIAEMHRRGT